MGFLTDPNGIFMELLRKISDIVFCNILFCVLCLPVITAGAAMTGLAAAMQLIAEDREDEGRSALKEFWLNFRTHFKRATLLWICGLGGLAFLFLYFHTVNGMEGSLGQLYRITFYALVMIFFAGYQYVFPMQARFGQGVRRTLVNAWLMAVAALPCTLLGLLIPAAAVILTFFLRPERFGGAVFFWAIIGFGLTAYLRSLAYLRAFRRIEQNRQ
jgi:uncharacterized membrane protein YesL